MHYGLKIETQKKNISEFSKIMNSIISSIENKKSEQEYRKNNYRRSYYYYNIDNTDYDGELNKICKKVIKYIPDDEEMSKLQKKIYKIYALFEDLEEQKIITSYEIFYKSVNRIIMSIINKNIEKLDNIQKASNKIKGDYIEFIKENQKLLDPNTYAILPDLNGNFKQLRDLKKNDGIYRQLLKMVSKFYYYGNRFDLNSILMNEEIKIKEFLPEKSMNNNDISQLINELIKLEILDPIEILKILPLKEEQLKQKEIIFIYENVFNQKLNTYELDLDPKFWETANEAIISKVIKKIEKKSLQNINKDEKISIKILEKLYKFKNPRTEGEDLLIVPNQNGKLKLYSDLSEEENISENFKKMLKEYFNYDINEILKHRDISLKFEKKLTVNEKIIDIIMKGLKKEIDNENKLKMAKALIKFYPNIKENNRIKEFGECFKILSGENYEMEQIETNYPTLWEKCIPLLTKYLLKLIDQDNNIENLCKRTKISEEEIFIVLNKFYSIMEKKKYSYNFIPNENNFFVDNLCVTDDISNDLKEALRLLNKEEDFSEFLLHPKVDRNNWDFPKKFVKDIAIIIDKNIKEKFKMFKNDKNNKDFDEDNFKKACNIILIQWFPKNYSNKEYMEYFEYTRKKNFEILLEVLSNEEELKNIKEYIFKDPLGLVKYMGKFNMNNNENENKEVSSHDNFVDYIDDNNSNNISRENNRINRSKDYSDAPAFEDDLISSSNNISLFMDKKGEKYDKSLNYIAQAYVYEKLEKKNIFKDIIWLNKSEEKDDEEIFIPSHYYIKDQKLNHEIEITSKLTNKKYYIKVKSSIMPNDKFMLYLSRIQWSNLKSLNNNYLFALVCLENRMYPEIAFVSSDIIDNL